MKEVPLQQLKALEKKVQGLKPWYAKAVRYIVIDGMTQERAAAMCGKSRVALARALRTDPVRQYRALVREELMDEGVDLALRTRAHLMRQSGSDLVKMQAVKDTLDRAGVGTEHTRPVTAVAVKLDF